MKKLSKVLLVFVVICMIPINVFACPHVDSKGIQHLQTYNSDYTEMTMIYPLENHLYTKLVDMYIDDIFPVPKEDSLISESFSFPVYQVLTSYITYYWFMDSTLLGTDMDKLDVKTTVEGINSMYVVGDSYHLNVDLTNSFDKSQKLINKYSDQIFYNINVDKLDNTTKYDDRIKRQNITLFDEDILKINAQYMITEVKNYQYTTEYEKINSFYDPVEVGIPTEEKENVIVLNLDKAFTEENIIYPTYSDGHYNFTINESGVYALANKDPDVELSEVLDETKEKENVYSDLEELEGKEENKSDKTVIYIVSASLCGIVLIGVLIIIIFKRKAK